MDEKVVRQFLVRGGRSYYRSPDFERERVLLSEGNADFDPCARYGIGFISLFMLGDKIEIETRRYYGSKHGSGDPLLIEINGVGGLIVLKRGDERQKVGTFIKVTGRKKPERFLTWKDKVRLTDTLYSYALGGEFPVRGVCSIPEIQREINIPGEIAKVKTVSEEREIKKCRIFRQCFSEVSPFLSGEIACDVLLDDEGKITLNNSEAGWELDDRGSAKFCIGKEEVRHMVHSDGKTCIDGILVAGDLGRSFKRRFLVGYTYPNPIYCGNDRFVLDVRGDLKPELNPDRSPPERGTLEGPLPGWKRLRILTNQAHGLLWAQVIKAYATQGNFEVIWQLLALHEVSSYVFQRKLLWNNLEVPSYDPANNFSMRRFSEIGKIPFNSPETSLFDTEESGWRVAIPPQMQAWGDVNNNRLVENFVRNIVLGMAYLCVERESAMLIFEEPSEEKEYIFSEITFIFKKERLSSIPFRGEASNCLSVVAAKRLINRDHPIARYLMARTDVKEDTAHVSFLMSLLEVLVSDGGLEALRDKDFSDRKLNFELSFLGYNAAKVDFEKLPPELSPPYSCWHKNSGFIQIEQDLLLELAEIEQIDYWQEQQKEYDI